MDGILKSESEGEYLCLGGHGSENKQPQWGTRKTPVFLEL
jgi:hypothetical protein